MALPPWTFELLRRGISDVARKASEPETLERLKTQAAELKSHAIELTGQASGVLQDLPESAARGLDRVLRSAEESKQQVQTWARKQSALALPMLNASGTLLHEFGTGVPVASDVLDAGYEVLRGDTLAGSAAASRIDRRLAKLSIIDNDRSMAIAASFSAAVSAISLLGRERTLVIHRSQAVRVGGSVPLPELLGGLVPGVREVGAVDDYRVEDFESLDAFCSITADAGGAAVRILDFADRPAKQICLLPVGAVHEIAGVGIPHAQGLLEQGADLVVLPGNGLCGGPECGVLIGNSELISTITRSTHWAAVRGTDAVAAMMCVALEKHQSSEESPIESLISTSQENLKARAERLAIRIGGSDRIRSAEAAAASADLVAGSRWKLPSWRVTIKPDSESADELRRRLLDSLPAILATVDRESVAIDLRWLPPSEDTKVAACFS